MEKAALDKYFQLRFRWQMARQEAIKETFAAALESGEFEPAIALAQEQFEADIETTKMGELGTEAERLGRENDTLFGLRSEGYINLDTDFTGLGWLRGQVAKAAAAPPAEQRAIARLIARYEDPDPGGFSDNLGVDGQQPRYAMNHNQTSQSIFADDICLAKDLELPEYKAQFFEFDIPRETTQDGELKLWFQKSAGVGERSPPKVTVWQNTGGWGTLCSEVWLIKKKMRSRWNQDAPSPPRDLQFLAIIVRHV